MKTPISLSLRWQFVLSFSVISIVTVVVGAMGLWALLQTNLAFQKTTNVTMPALDALTQIDSGMESALVAERSLFFISLESPEAKRLLSSNTDSMQRVTHNWNTYSQQQPEDDAETKRRTEFSQALSTWMASSKEALSILKQDTPAARRDAIDISMNEGTAKFDAAKALLHAIALIRTQQAQEFANAEAARAITMRGVLVAMMGIAFIVAIAFGFLLARRIAGRVHSLSDAMTRISNGDLTVQLQPKGGDEIGTMALAFCKLIERLREVVQEVHAGSAAVSESAQGMVASASTVLSGSKRQSESATITAATLEEITASITSVSDNADNVHKLSSESLLRTKDGTQKLNELQKEIQSVEASVGEMTNTVNAFVQSTSKITSMTQRVKEIAAQTNLLALNAAIEAARAGEQGRGFSVVADEVRNLAGKSSESATEIDGVTHVLGDQSRNVEASMQKSLCALQSIQEFMQDVTAVISAAGNAAILSNEGVDEISISIRQQIQAADEISKSMEQVAQMAETNTKSVEDATRAAHHLQQLAGNLRTSVGWFKM